MIYFGLYIILLILLDMSLTLFSISLFRKYKPRANWYDAEANGMVVYLWKRLGIRYGTLAALLIQIFMVSILLVTVLNRDMIFFMFGMYTLLLYFHWSNIVYFKDKLNKKYEKNKRKIKT